MGEYETMLTHNDACALLRYIAVRSVQIAQSGHPGAPLGCSDIMTVLWQKWLHVDPENPQWINRDRFILSNGHASAMLYALLYLRGYNITWEDLTNFRTLHSPTPGHPEYDPMRMIEATTGPLGQGFAQAVGIAKAGSLIRQSMQYTPPLIDYRTYVLVGDGCLMEGISHEVANMASTWQLDRLIVMWDDNNITIDGEVSTVSRENTLDRFRAYGWHVIGPVDGHDPRAIHEAFQIAQLCNGQPKFIAFTTIIGKGVIDGQGSEKMHGSPLTETQWQRLREDLNITDTQAQDPDIIDSWRKACPERYTAWMQSYAAYTQERPDDARHWSQLFDKKLALETPSLPVIEHKVLSTRLASHKWIQAACALNNSLVGGSADLSSSVLTDPGVSSLSPYLHYGVREFGMCGVANGLALCGYRPFVGTFLVFSDYAKSAIRSAAMMELPVTYVLTHDSIGLGEDGPTHQPVEHILTLRAIPQLETWRPADAYETYAIWDTIVQSPKGPHALILSRQHVPVIPQRAINLEHGAYAVHTCNHPELIIIATGSEVSLALQVPLELPHRKICIISCPNLGRFKHSVLHKTLQHQAPFFIIEAGSSWSWGDIQPDPHYRLTLDAYGASAPGEHVQKDCGFSIDNVLSRLRDIGIS